MGDEGGRDGASGFGSWSFFRFIAWFLGSCRLALVAWLLLGFQIEYEFAELECFEEMNEEMRCVGLGKEVTMRNRAGCPDFCYIRVRL